MITRLLRMKTIKNPCTWLLLLGNNITINDPISGITDITLKNYSFSHNFTQKTDRIMILMSIYMFSSMRNSMVPIKMAYVWWPSWNSRWTPIFYRFFTTDHQSKSPTMHTAHVILQYLCHFVL